ncbi:MAG: hypothetical protein ACLFST_08110 [Spirochaetia bacterium]
MRKPVLVFTNNHFENDKQELNIQEVLIMGKTELKIAGEDFFINGKKVYADIAGTREEVHGLLMNARFIQGIFDDKAEPERFNRFGIRFDPEENTQKLIDALPEWYSYGLRAFTVGFQGGGPCFTTDNRTIENNPFGGDGLTLDPAYAARMDKLIRAADKIGMAVIVSYFYPGQVYRINDGRAVANAVRTASRFLKENRYSNVIIEVCNEMDVDKAHPIIHQPEGMAVLIEIAKEQSGGLPVGCSPGGGNLYREVCEASDVILIHGNGCSRQKLYNLISRARKFSSGKPVVCNEDSQAVGQLKVAGKTHSSWGYYNNMTKQEPPADWGVTKGEDYFFAWRMAETIGIRVSAVPFEEQYYLQGLEPNLEHEGQRWIRLASLYPEGIDFVDFYCNGEPVYTCYDEPFAVNFKSNWFFKGVETKQEDHWKAVVYLRDGRKIEK